MKTSAEAVTTVAELAVRSVSEVAGWHVMLQDLKQKFVMEKTTTVMGKSTKAVLVKQVKQERVESTQVSVEKAFKRVSMASGPPLVKMQQALPPKLATEKTTIVTDLPMKA